jgi:hypothetical protein
MSTPEYQIEFASRKLLDLLNELEVEQQKLNKNEEMLKKHRETNNFGPFNQDWPPALEASEKEYVFEELSSKHKQKIWDLRKKINDCYRIIQQFEKELFEGRSNRIIGIRDAHKKKAEEERMRAEKRQSNHEQSYTNYHRKDPVTGQKVLERTVRNGKTVYEKKTDVQFNPYFV